MSVFLRDRPTMILANCEHIHHLFGGFEWQYIHFLMGRRPEKKCRNLFQTRLFLQSFCQFMLREEILQFSVFFEFQFIIGIDCPPRKMKTFYNQIIVCKYAFFLDHCLQSELSILASHFFYASRLATSITGPALILNLKLGNLGKEYLNLLGCFFFD